MTRPLVSSTQTAFSALALALGLAFTLVACGEPSCPAGSVAVGDRCEVGLRCGKGEVPDGGECVEAGDGDKDASTGDGDSAVSESADALCDALDCGEHGACKIKTGEATCVCSAGFAGELCDECEEGLVPDGKACVAPCDASDAPQCGEHGTCEDGDDGSAMCTCEHPYVGETCAECAEGFALADSGVCEPDCGACGDHEFCNEALMTPACECVAGYADRGDGCGWVGDGVTGGIVDGDLEDPDAWEHDYVSFQDGRVAFENVMSGNTCKMGSIGQTIRMPARADAEPLVLEIQARATCGSTDEDSCPALLVDIGDTVTRLPMAGGPSSLDGALTVCLGDAAFGEEVELRVRPGLAMATASITAPCSAPWPELQRIAIRRAGAVECPKDGATLGNLSSEAGWVFESGSNVATNRLQLAENRRATTLISIPAEGSYAVKIATAQALTTSVFLDGLELHLGAPVSTSTICLPPWAHGGVHRLGLEASLSAAQVTELTVEESGSCEDGFDDGFERALGTGSWSAGFVPAAVEIYESAHSPSRAWRVQSAQSLLGSLILVPRPSDGMRATFSVWTRVGGFNMSGTLTVLGAGLSNHKITTTAQSFGRTVVCLAEEWAGQPAAIRVGGNSTMTNSVSGTPALWVDDMGITTIGADACD